MTRREDQQVTTEPTGFNWHDEDRDSFRQWLMPTLITEIGADKFAAISEATAAFTDVRLTIQVNGIEVDATRFVDGVQSNMHYFADRKAEEIVRDRIDGLRTIEDIFAATRKDIERTLIGQLKAVGVEVREEEW